MVRVLHVSHAQKYSGAEIVLANILRNNKLWQNCVLVPGGPFYEHLNKLGIQLIRSKYLSNVNRKVNLFWPVVFFFKFILASFELTRAAKKYRPEIIFASHLSSAPYCILTRIFYRKKIILHMHDIHKPRTLESFSVFIISLFADKIVAISEVVKEALIKSGVNPKKIVRCYNGIDKDDCFPDISTDSPVIIKEKGIINIAQIGLLEPRKGVDLFIKAAKIILADAKYKQKIRFYIVGETISHPEYVAEIRNLVKSFGLQDSIVFTGRVENIKQVYQNIDIAVLASRTPEPFGMVLLEAMVMNVLAVAANIGAVPEIIDDGDTGLLFKPDDAEDLVAKLSAVIDRDINVPQIIRNAEQKTIEKFSLEKQKNCIYQTIKSLT